MTRCVPPQEGRCCHRLAGLRMLIPSLASIYCRCPGPPQAQGLVSPVRESGFTQHPQVLTGGPQPLPWDSGPSLMAPPLFWTPGTDSGPGSRTSKRTQVAAVAPVAYQPCTPSYRRGCQEHLPGVAASRKLPLCPSGTPPSLPDNVWKSLLLPQPSHWPELAHTGLPNTPCPLKTPLGWGLPRPQDWLEDLNSGDAEACLEPAFPSALDAQVPKSCCGWVWAWLQGLLMMCLAGSPNPQTHTGDPLPPPPRDQNPVFLRLGAEAGSSKHHGQGRLPASSPGVLVSQLPQ